MDPEVRAEDDLPRDVYERYELAKQLLTDTTRRRLLTYGTDSSKLLLQCFDDLGELLDEQAYQDQE